MMPRLEAIRQTIGRDLRIDPMRLNSMPLEDVELSDEAREALFDDLAAAVRSGDQAAAPSGLACEIGLPCTGFWVDGTRDLVIHVWNNAFARTFVIPSQRWSVRSEATRH
jgi:hypothetical protein